MQAWQRQEDHLAQGFRATTSSSVVRLLKKILPNLVHLQLLCHRDLWSGKTSKHVAHPLKNRILDDIWVRQATFKICKDIFMCV